MSRGKAIPLIWVPTNDDREYGRSLGLTISQIDDFAEDMRIWAGANANRGIARKANWSLAFKGWMRREAKKMKGNGNGFRGSRQFQNDDLSVGRAAGRLAAELGQGTLSFAARPCLLPAKSEDDLRLLPKR